MKTSPYKIIATFLFILLLLAPAIGTLLLDARGLASSAAFSAWLVFAAMSLYTIPFFGVSVIGLTGGYSYQKQSRTKASKIAFLVSICASLAGSIFMIAWGLN